MICTALNGFAKYSLRILPEKWKEQLAR